MPKNNFYISFGVWIIILPLLGIPSTWKSSLIFLSGLFLILVSLGPVILGKLQTKEKPKKTTGPAKLESKVPNNPEKL